MILWKKTGALLGAALLLSGLVAGEAEARGKRMTQLPNGGVAGCNTCHTGGGGTPRNPFGLEMQANFLTASGSAGDVVVFCPDQLAPAGHRLLADGFTTLSHRFRH